MNGIKRVTRTSLALAAILGVAACDSFLDVNTDPNNQESVDLRLTLPGILISAHDILGPTAIRYQNMVGPTGWGTEWLQQWSDNEDRHTYEQFQWYEVQHLNTDGYWADSYSGVMKEANNMMLASAEAGQWQHHGIAKFILAWNMSLVADAFGSAPFSEAFDYSNRNPKYDSQQEIYARVFELIDEAIEEMQMDDPFPPATNDLLFQGDMAGWLRLAHSVKARLHMRLVYAPGENAQQHAQAALDALALGIQSPAEAPVIPYDGGSGNRQPWYQFESSSRTRSSKWYIDMLVADADPRLPIMANPADSVCPVGVPYTEEDCTTADPNNPVYRGNQSGGPGEPNAAISQLGSFFTADSMDHVWFTYEDTKFLEAEARLLIDGPAAADVPYREAIRANMERLGVAEPDIDAYLATRPPLQDEPNPLEALITEKFKSNFLRDEVWHDYRRTGFPQVPLVEERMIDGIPQRLRLPASEIQFNADAVAASGIDTSLEGSLVPVWWASGSPPTSF